jgi:DNA-binding PadR family transcriptional regulator
MYHRDTSHEQYPGRKGTDVLELAVLGLLHESPMHGYELRKRLNAALGVFRALSYGTLYPCLRGLLDQGLISEASGIQHPAATSGSKRARIVYELTADGKEHFQELVKEAGPTAWEDDTFDVHFAFFARTEAEVRLRILEGRRSRLEERLANIRTSSAKNRERFDTYTAALERHGLDSAEREVRWLNELITAERNVPTSATTRHTAAARTAPPAPHPRSTKHTTT